MAQDSSRGARRAQCPDEVLAFIPWYADGGLDAREKGLVEAHAAQCAECRAELDLVAGAPWSTEDVVLPDRERLFDEIRARIDREARGESARANVIPISRGRVLSDDDMNRIERWILDPRSEQEVEPQGERAAERAGEGAPIPLRPRFVQAPLWAAAAALVLFFAGGVSGVLAERFGFGSRADEAAGSGGADYQLASAPQTQDGTADEQGASAAGAREPMLDVVFADSVTAREIWSGLRALGVEVVSGPTNLGVYRLRVVPAADGRTPSAADAAAVAARLVAPESRLAIFAEPVP